VNNAYIYRKDPFHRHHCIQSHSDTWSQARDLTHRKQTVCSSGVVLKNEVGEHLEIEVETVAKNAILQEFCIV